jgi:hypothetical protein
MIDERTENTALSDAGRSRREAMLCALVDAMRARRVARARRRRAASAALSLALVGALAAAIVNRVHRETVPPERGAVQAFTDPRPDQSDAGQPARVVIVHTDRDIMDRYRAQPRLRAVVVDDDGLIEALRESRREAGIARFGGRTTLTRAVTDAELRQRGADAPHPHPPA